MYTENSFFVTICLFVVKIIDFFKIIYVFTCDSTQRDATRHVSCITDVYIDKFGEKKYQKSSSS